MTENLDYQSLVRRLRTARRLTQEQLAHELGVTFGTVNSWESGRHRPSPLAAKLLLREAADAGIAVGGAEAASAGAGATRKRQSRGKVR